MSKNIFPPDFLWGGALSANQSEGCYQADGKSLTIADVYRFEPENSGKRAAKPAGLTRKQIEEAKAEPENTYYPKRRGIDFYHTYQADIALLAGMGFKAFRYSICWSRIFPDVNQEKPNEKALAFYDAVIDECLKYGMEPVITILHADLPIQIIDEYKGWSDRQVADLFARYCKTLFLHFKGRVKYWIPFNEINMDLINATRKMGVLKEDHEDYDKAVFQALHYEFLASAMAVKLAHEISSENRVGAMLAYFTTYPYTCSPEDVLAAQKQDEIRNLLFYDVLLRGKYPYYIESILKKRDWKLDITEKDRKILAENTADFAALSYYNSMVHAHDTSKLEIIGGNVIGAFKNPYIRTNEWGWAIDPVGLRYTLNHIYEIFQKPLFILENGSGFVEEPNKNRQIHDEYRVTYFREHIEQMRRAVEDGVDLIGYTTWSPIDVVAASTGQMKKRYGFIYVDQDDYGNGSKKRIIKDSYYWYQKVIASNGEDLT